MEPSLRLVTVALIVLASLLWAAALQIGVRMDAVGALSRARTAVHVVEGLRATNLAVIDADPRAPSSLVRAQIAAVRSAIAAAADVTNLPGTTPDANAGWFAFRDGWARAQTGDDIRRLQPASETAIRNGYLRVAAVMLSQKNSGNRDRPFGEAALIALPALETQERRLAVDLARWDGRSDVTAALVRFTERTARATAIGWFGFVVLRGNGMSGLSHEIAGYVREATDTSATFLDLATRSTERRTVAADRLVLARNGRLAADAVDRLETTLLPDLDRRLEAGRQQGVREIVIESCLVVAIVAITGFLVSEALSLQTRSRRSREALEHQAAHDALTGLPNRRAFAEATAAVVSAWTPINDRTVWLLSIDLDYFKEVNDRYGHQTGDRFLIAAAERLRAAAPPGDLVARVGGDEFAVLVHHYDPDSAHAVDVAQGICDAFAAPIAVDGVRHRLAASVGIVAVDAMHETVDSLLRDADIAMYGAKEEGGDRAVVFDDTLRQAIVYRAELTSDLRGAIGTEQISVMFQPIVSLRPNVCTGFEALVRWNHPEHGLVDAGLLIEIAQDARLIDELGRHIVHEVCRHLAGWRDRGLALDTLSMHVNISPMEAVHADTFGSIAHALDQYGIPPPTLVIELTETASMDSIEPANLFLAMLHAIDVRICLDDFGTGYSSLRHLNDFHVDAIKIDRSFVVSAADDAAKEPIIAGVIALANGLNAEVVAEGIETLEQLAIVERLGCNLVQGYLFARPLSPDDALAFVQRAVPVSS